MKEWFLTFLQHIHYTVNVSYYPYSNYLIPNAVLKIYWRS